MTKSTAKNRRIWLIRMRRERMQKISQQRALMGTDAMPFPVARRLSKIKAEGQPELVEIPLDSLVATQPKYFPERAAQYEQAYRKGEKVRRVLVLQSGDRHLIWDGHHKAIGAKLAGVTTVRALRFRTHYGVEPMTLLTAEELAT